MMASGGVKPPTMSRTRVFMNRRFSVCLVREGAECSDRSSSVAVLVDQPVQHVDSVHGSREGAQIDHRELGDRQFDLKVAGADPASFLPPLRRGCSGTQVAAL